MSTLETDDDIPLYESRKKIYPQSVDGPFRRAKWAIMLVTLGIYYFLPFVRWDRGPHAPDQAVLIDFANRRFYFFFVEIWPQEVYYLTGLLIIAAVTLFLMNAVAGRVWCGYLCPQTVWTDLFYQVERWVEGDRRDRIMKDKGPLTATRVREIATKHFLWLMIAWWTGGAWVLYFADAPTLVRELATFQAPFIAYLWIGILTFTTYTLAGFMREQVCIYMCPWPRIQAALTDEWALNVTYKYDRGEPRASLKQAERAKAAGQALGDCIDCRQCIAVCPTGIDIREGSQLACIQCGLCIDACDAVMRKVNRPTRLIGYDNDINIHRRRNDEPEIHRLVRPRTVLYAAIIVAVALLMVVSLATRSTIGIAALHDRNPVHVVNSDGSIRNAWTVRLTNKVAADRTYALAVEGLPNARLDVVGGGDRLGRRVLLPIGPDQTRELRVLVTVPRGAPASTPITFVLTDVADGESARVRDHFLAP